MKSTLPHMIKRKPSSGKAPLFKAGGLSDLNSRWNCVGYGAAVSAMSWEEFHAWIRTGTDE